MSHSEHILVPVLLRIGQVSPPRPEDMPSSKMAGWIRVALYPRPEVKDAAGRRLQVEVTGEASLGGCLEDDAISCVVMPPYSRLHQRFYEYLIDQDGRCGTLGLEAGGPGWVCSFCSESEVGTCTCCTSLSTGALIRDVLSKV
ncbi:hypothetical protein EYF80_041883 [Liparis tanakae]|uniref:Uncharacterized protein n=1 Tax=Liparis tanakae TaxID=230148 RepID=A0A4Z2G419_9TELE|nr:hypothetical protein EYF80_041883 [Liparis tanakae]